VSQGRKVQVRATVVFTIFASHQGVCEVRSLCQGVRRSECGVIGLFAWVWVPRNREMEVSHSSGFLRKEMGER